MVLRISTFGDWLGACLCCYAILNTDSGHQLLVICQLIDSWKLAMLSPIILGPVYATVRDLMLGCVGW